MSRHRCHVSFALLGAIALLVAGAASAQERRPIDPGEQKHLERLQAEARELDAEAAGATATPEGQRRVTQALAKQFKVPESVVTDLRNPKPGYGGVAITLALSDELMKRDKSLTRQQAIDSIVARHQAGQGWGVIARDLGLKLGHVVSEVKKTEKHVADVSHARSEKAEKAEKGDRAAKVEKAEKPEKFEKPERPEKPMKPEKPGR